MTRRNLVLVLAALLLLAVVWGTVPSTQARGFTVTVNSIGDLGDFNPGNGLCATAPPMAEGGDECTLRAAIEELNAQGPDTTPHHIEFDIPGSGLFVIMPASPLPDIEVPVEIDGETQPGAACPTVETPANLLIVLDGANAGTTVYGLTLSPGSDGSTIRGLVIGNFSALGIQVNSNDNAFRCNHIGLAADGVSNMGNGWSGININGDGNVVGGVASAQQRNVISYNGSAGVYIGGDDNFVGNNFVGSHADGLGDGGNDDGIYVSGIGNQIGGPSLLARNLIGGNDGFGIRVNNGLGNVLQGNGVGIARDGTTPLPNGSDGIEILGGAITNTVGGPAPLEANLIANNGGAGIYVDDNVGGMPARNRIQGNLIFDNADLGIDLGADGVDVNDDGDGDTGENEHQNYPILLSANGSLVEGTLNSQPNTEYTLDFYGSETCDPSGYGEGQVYLGNDTATTNGSGDASFIVALSSLLPPDSSITATATDPDGNTSEFSACITATGGATPTPTPSATPTDSPSPTPTATPTDGPSPTPTATLPPPSDWMYLPAVPSDGSQ